ncbi:hypothetical protein SGLAM104S_06026 [Streptomyces glaucescens]
MHHSFPEDWYDTAPGLWLNSITRTGYAPGDTTGTLQSADGVSFSHYTVGSESPLKHRLRDRQLPNLVPAGKGDQTPGFTRPRIGTVSTENGGDIEVEYTGGCATAPAEDKGKSNGTCYPVRWSIDPDVTTPPKVWFNKYVVASVTETDKVTSHGKPITTTYQYSGPAWAKSDDEFTRSALRTYSDWKGYRQVSVRKGSKSTSEQGEVNGQSRTVTRYFQGVGGAVKDSTDKYTLLADDAPQFSGMAAEVILYEDSDGEIEKRTLTFPPPSRPRPADARTRTERRPIRCSPTGRGSSGRTRFRRPTPAGARSARPPRSTTPTDSPPVWRRRSSNPAAPGSTTPTRPAPRRNTCTTPPPGSSGWSRQSDTRAPPVPPRPQPTLPPSSSRPCRTRTTT